ncbi:MAG: hypothetical protein ACXWV5_08985 [Flavitalea sp.]
MKNSYHTMIIRLRVGFILVVLATISLFAFSFKIASFNTDLLSKLGMTKSSAEEKITNSILWGSIDAYGVKNLKNLATGNKAAITKDLLIYTKKHVASQAFLKEYAAMKESKKPKMDPVQTPEEFRNESIAQMKKSVSELEVAVKNADKDYKPMFENSLKEAQKQLKAVEDPNNKNQVSYRKNYPGLLADLKRIHESQLADWEKKFPTNHLLFVKQRLKQFLEETKDIDFSAELVEKNGKKKFVDPIYERKSNRWKMGFRAGKEVVETSRAFVEQWITEIGE